MSPEEQTELEAFKQALDPDGMVAKADRAVNALREPVYPFGNLPNTIRQSLAELMEALLFGRAQAIRETERARDQACMAAMCPLCAEGVRPVEKRGNDLWHVSKPGQGGILLPDGHCIAQPIREMTDDDQAK